MKAIFVLSMTAACACGGQSGSKAAAPVAPVEAAGEAGASAAAPASPAPAADNPAATEPPAPSGAAAMPCAEPSAVATLELAAMPVDGTVGSGEIGPASTEQAEQVREAASSMDITAAVVVGKSGYGIASNFEYSFAAWIQVTEWDEEYGSMVAKQNIPLPKLNAKRHKGVEGVGFVADRNRDGNQELWLRYDLEVDPDVAKGNEISESFLLVYSLPDMKLLLETSAGRDEQGYNEDGDRVAESKCEVKYAIVDVGCDKVGDIIIDESCTTASCADGTDGNVCVAKGKPTGRRSLGRWNGNQGKFEVTSL